jgi:hypothetical protein
MEVIMGPSRFPKDAIRGLAKEFSDTYSQYLESPWQFWAFSFLTCLGNILGDRATIASAIKPQPRLFTILLGESARTRKSSCIEQTLEFFSKALPQEFLPCRGVGSAEGLAEVLKDKPKTVLVFDEFKVFVSKAIHRGSILLPCVNTLFEANTFHSHTKTSRIKVDTAYLSILAASTTETFLSMWTQSFTDIGFINRLWLVPGESKRRFATPKPIPKIKMKLLRKKLVSLVPKADTKFKKLKMTPKARNKFFKWYKKMSDSIYADRLETYGHRLMILFCINEGRTKINYDIVERVIKLLDWQLMVREENQPIDAEGKVAKLEQLIRRALSSGPLEKRDLQRKVHYDRPGIWAWNLAVNNLKNAGEIEFDAKHQSYRRINR